MSLTYRKSINKYTDLPSHEITRANKDGERDGKENFPESSETEPSGAILKILTDARTAWDKYLSEKKNYLEDQNKKLSNLEYDIDTNIQIVPLIEDFAVRQKTAARSRLRAA